jgi:predicted ABC-class ATPase
MLLWFWCSFSDPLKKLYGNKVVNGKGSWPEGRETTNGHPTGKGFSQQIVNSSNQRCLNTLRRVFSQFVGEIIEAMAGYIPLPAIMAKLLSDNGSQEFGDFKLVIHRMLSMYLYEKRILVHTYWLSFLCHLLRKYSICAPIIRKIGHYLIT